MKNASRLLTPFVAVIALLVTIGFIFIYSSSSVFALETCGSASFFVKKQLLGLTLGLVAMGAMIIAPFDLIRRLAPWFFLFSIILTYLTLVPSVGMTINGSSRWLHLAGFSFQPSELLKVACILYLASYIGKKEFRLRSFTYGYLPFLLLIGVAIAALLKQPDFGQAVTITLTSFIMFFIARGSVRHLFYTGLVSAVGAALLVYLKAYRLRRILVFLNPWADPKGAGFQIIQSLVAIGSGGLWGVGISHSKQKFFYLPMQHTDFIFSVIAEETGFVGVLVLVALYLLLFIFGIRIARAVGDQFTSLVTLGTVFLINLQAVMHIFVASGLAPTKGIGLPFISYGNSSLICNLLLIGVVINGVLENKST
ncbi:MAG: putative lipid II flippase FtsW [Candidatus Dependentiae bacterium]|nr:putative lipid II flippase FtsW [Candidatus Dependentiae bacterium]